jgi:two-component system NtrC family sensor kinase
MFRRLPYRAQIPLGLSMAVLVTAVLVTAVTAQISVRTARQDILSTLDRSVVLLIAQARPMLAADDTWRVFSLLRDTATLIPGTEVGKARIAVLDAEGRVFAASDPARLEIGKVILGGNLSDQLLATATDVNSRLTLDLTDGGVVLVDPIRSEDGQTLGFVLLEVDAPVFAPKWSTLAQPALIAVVLAVMFLVPLGWMVGKRMTRPVARLAQVIERIGHSDGANLQADVPRTNDPELSRIGDAVLRLMDELQKREKAELRALSAERLAAVGRMTAAVAHEINNPLAGLLTATQTLRLHGESEVVRGRTIDLLNRGLQQIRTTVAALLPQARVEDRPLELGDLEDAITLVQPAAKLQDVQVSSRNDVESALRVPSAVMRQVMLNMLLNAVKAAGHQGRVDSLLRATSDRVQFCVTNTGESLSAEAFAHALAAESGRDPRGFGLWVCRELASHFDGGFELDVLHAGGTRLIFWMPNRDKREVIV